MPDEEGLSDSLPKIVEAIARVFREEGKPQQALLLSQASMTVQETSYDNWNGGTYGYTLQLQVPARMFAGLGADVDKLEEEIKLRIGRFARLYPSEHVEAVVIAPSLTDESDASASRMPTAPLFWKDGAFRLFLSHVSAHKDQASQLAVNLSDHGITGFVAHEDIEPTKEWEDEIRLALTTCDALACLLTESFGASKWTDQEVGFAIGRGTLVIPIRLGLDPYGFIARHQGYSGLRASLPELADAIARILAKHEQTRVKMASALVKSFEQSDSFASAKRRASHLEVVQYWNKDLIEIANRATVDNYQIAHAFGVPERVRRFLATLSTGGA